PSRIAVLECSCPGLVRTACLTPPKVYPACSPLRCRSAARLHRSGFACLAPPPNCANGPPRVRTPPALGIEGLRGSVRPNGPENCLDDASDGDRDRILAPPPHHGPSSLKKRRSSVPLKILPRKRLA